MLHISLQISNQYLACFSVHHSRNLESGTSGCNQVITLLWKEKMTSKLSQKYNYYKWHRCLNSLVELQFIIRHCHASFPWILQNWVHLEIVKQMHANTVSIWKKKEIVFKFTEIKIWLPLTQRKDGEKHMSILQGRIQLKHQRSTDWSHNNAANVFSWAKCWCMFS